MVMSGKLLVAGCLLAAAPYLSALDINDWTVESVIKKVVEANGGAQAIQGTTDLRMRGKVKSPEATYDFLLLKKRPNKLRIHLMYRGRSVETGFDGNIGWQRTWIDGKDAVRPLTKEEMAKADLETDFDGPLVGEASFGETRTLVGVERVDRTDYFIVVVESQRIRTTHYVDSRTFREWKTIRAVLDDSGEVQSESTSYYSNYRKHKSIWIAETVTRTNQDGATEEIIIEETEINPGILDRAFTMPKQWSDTE